MNIFRVLHQPSAPSRASSLWQIVHHAWSDFRRGYEDRHRRSCGPLRGDAVAVVERFHHCGDLSAGFTRFQCPDCGHECLLAFTCKNMQEIPLDDGRVLVLDGDPVPPEAPAD